MSVEGLPLLRQNKNKKKIVQRLAVYLVGHERVQGYAHT